VLVIVTDCDALAVSYFTEPNARLLADKATVVTPVPVPLNVIFCGELPALSVMVMVVARVPTAAGAKCPWMEQFAPAARLVPQLFANTNEEASAPVKVMLEIDRAAVPVFVIVIDCDPLAVPTLTEPNERLVAEKLTAGPVPVPPSETVWGEPVALSVKLNAALNEPTAAGLKVTAIVHLAPAATLVPQVLVSEKELALVPVMPTLVNERAPVPVLLRVMFGAVEDDPTAWLENVSEFAESVTMGAGAVPVPLRRTVCGEP
jgi:hypothetical protein